MDEILKRISSISFSEVLKYGNLRRDSYSCYCNNIFRVTVPDAKLNFTI